jgi:hypothetical protein
LKAALVATLAATTIVSGLGFTSKKGNTISTFKRSTSTYYYKSGTPYQRLEPGHTTEVPLCERTIIPQYFKNVNNWTTTFQSSTITSNYSLYIGSITFDEEATADGGSDGQLTFQEALNAAWDGFVSTNPNVMRQSYTVNENAAVKVTTVTSCR